MSAGFDTTEGRTGAPKARSVWGGTPRLFGLLLLVAGCSHTHPGSEVSSDDANPQPLAALLCGRPLGVAAGGAHSCAVCESGGAVCWGANEEGQLGDGTQEGRGLPVRVEGLEDALAIVAGEHHSCALRRGGKVACWGAGHPRAEDVAALGEVRGLAAGGDRTCAVDGGGEVWCWTLRGEGASLPAAVPLVEGAVGVAVGVRHSCAVQKGGTVLCWGDNSRGQLGTEPRTQGGDGQGALEPLQVPGLVDAVEVAAGAEHTCAKRQNGAVWCWGAERRGQLGRGFEEAAMGGPREIAGLEDAQFLTAGGNRTCAVRGQGSVVCWGEGERGPLAESVSVFRPEGVRGLAGVLRASAGRTHACAVLADGGVACWGQSASGQLGWGKPLAYAGPVRVRGFAEGPPAEKAFSPEKLQPEPVPLAAFPAVSTFSVGSCQTCAVLEPGRRLACLDTDVFRTSAGAVRASTQVPVTVLERVSQVSMGACRGCALLEDGQVRCWGVGGRAGLGDGVPGDTGVPVRVGTPGSVAQVSTGGFSCALGKGGEVWCWGENAQGQVSPALSTEPVLRPALLQPSPQGPLTELSVGSDFGCVRSDVGDVFCWGSDRHGQLGSGSALTRRGPVRVEGVEHAVGLDTGHAHACAALANGRVRCWGWNAFGQLGTASTERVRGSVEVPGVEDAVAVSAGERHSCALLRSGEVACWGQNSSGELGDGTREQRLAPVKAVGLVDAVELSLGDARTCARRVGGEVRCWGRR